MSFEAEGSRLRRFNLPFFYKGDLGPELRYLRSRPSFKKPEPGEIEYFRQSKGIWASFCDQGCESIRWLISLRCQAASVLHAILRTSSRIHNEPRCRSMEVPEALTFDSEIDHGRAQVAHPARKWSV